MLLPLLAFILVTTCVPHAYSNKHDSSNWSSLHPNINSCSDGHSGLYANGPCQSTLIFCHNGLPTQLNCLDPLVFNPVSKFCEKPEDFISPPSPTQSYVVQHVPDTEVQGGNPSVFYESIKPMIIPDTKVQGGSPSVFYEPVKPVVSQYNLPEVNGPSVFYEMAKPSTDHVDLFGTNNPSNSYQSDKKPPVLHYDSPEVEGPSNSYQSDKKPPVLHYDPPEVEGPSAFYEPIKKPAVIHYDSPEVEGPSAFYEPIKKPLVIRYDSPEVEGPSVFYQPDEKPFVGHYDLPQFEGPSVFYESEERPSANNDLPEAHGPHASHEMEEKPMINRNDYPKDEGPSVSYESDEKPFAIDSDSTEVEGARLSYEKKRKPMVGHNDNPKAEGPVYREPETESVDDVFFEPSHHIETEQEDVAKPLIDNFKTTDRELYAQKVSAFAPLDSPADTGHDAFKALPHRQSLQSGFAPMNTPVDLGHDVFKTRRKRSTTGKETTAPIFVHQSLVVCRQLYAEQLASRSTNQTNSTVQPVPCARNEVPNGCRPFYLACVDGRQVRRQCPVGLYFDRIKEACGRREEIAACLVHQMPTNKRVQPAVPKQQLKKRPILPTYAHFSPEKFCSELPNGFYRHPKNCSRIVQCFGNDIFEYPSCQHDLAFNELKGVCDYPGNVPGCSPPGGDGPMNTDVLGELAHRLANDGETANQANPVPASDTASKDVIPSTQISPSPVASDPTGMCAGGHSHGDHIEHPEHCSAFFRCVWGRLVPMSCPQGTAFNPLLSVCDYPSQVPNCQTA